MPRKQLKHYYRCRACGAPVPRHYRQCAGCGFDNAGTVITVNTLEELRTELDRWRNDANKKTGNGNVGVGQQD